MSQCINLFYRSVSKISGHFFSSSCAMAAKQPSITLSDKEIQLRGLLLDAASYIGALEGHEKPELRFTGGWVRDKLLGTASHDIDVGINNMTGFQFANLLKEHLEHTQSHSTSLQERLGSLSKIAANPEKSKHLETVTTKLLGFDLDFVNLRKETYTDHSRNPAMEFGTPKEDALRRDATVNALFYNIDTCEVEDFTERGLIDMRRKVIKTPLAPLQTFKDDPLRILRCIRFASRLEFDIDPEDEAAMSNPSIKDVLRQKISRERVGQEVTKMLKGRHPDKALLLIDRLGLYNDIFTDPTNPTCTHVETENWSKAYRWLLTITNTEPSTETKSSPFQIIRAVLVRDSDDAFRAWLLASIVPWGKVPVESGTKVSAKKALTPAGIAVREGIKADNKMSKMVDDCVLSLIKAKAMKEMVDAAFTSLESPRKRKEVSIGREVHGQLLRGWGSNWRNVVLFALLFEVYEAESDSGKVLCAVMRKYSPSPDAMEISRQYALWMTEIQSLELLDVDKLIPLVKGDQICKALGNVKQGHWLREALNIAMEWQLRNPHETDPSGGIAEVLQRSHEVNLP